MKTLKLESKMNKKPSQSIDQAISALVDHNIKKSFKASDANDDNNFDPLNLTIESAMALLDRHYRLDKSAYISIRSKLKDKIVKNGIRQSKILYKEADKEFNRLVGRAPVRYVAPRPARLSPIESAQASVRSLRETESKLRISLSHLKPGTSEYNDAHEHLVRILSQLKAAENPLSAFYEGYAFGSQDLEGSQPKNESDSARRSRLEGIYPSLKKRVEAEQLNFFHLVGLIANAEKRIQRLQDLYHHGHSDDKALIQENNSLVERLHVLLVNYQNSMREMPGHIKRLNEVAKALNEYYQDDEDHENPGLDWGLIALNDFIKLGSDGKIKSPGQLALRFGNLIGDISQLPTVIASLPNLKIREMSNALSQGLTGEPIADSIYQDPIVQATQQVGVMGAYLIPGVGEVLSLASLLSLKQAMERDPIGTFREVYDSFNPLANKIHDPETGNLRGATPADRIVRGLNLLMLAVGAYHLKGGLTMDGLAKALGNEYHISFAEGKKFVEDLNADLLKVRVEEEARQQLKANAKKGNFKSVDDYLEAHPNALKKTIAEIEKSPNLMKKLSLPQQIEQLGNAKGVKERIERARNAPPGRGSDGENRLGGAVSTMGGNGPVGGEGLTGAGGTPTSKSTKSAASSVVQGPKSGSGVAVAVRGTETAKAQGASSTAEASANKKAGPFERVWVEEAGTNAINGGSVPKFDVSAIQDGGTWLYESPFRKSSPFELPQPNGKPSGITFELGKDGHNLTLSDGSSFTITKPLWQSFLEQGTQPFGASLFGIGRGFANPAQNGANSHSFSFGLPSDTRRFSDLGDPTKSGSASGQPTAAGGTSANGQARTAVQPQANSGGVAVDGAAGATDPQIVIVGGNRLKIEAVPTYPYVRFTPIPSPTDPAATPKTGLGKDAAVALIGGNQGAAGQSTTIGDPTTNPTSPPPTDPMNPTTPAKPGVQGINEMETPKGYIFDISHPGWQQRTLQHIRQIEEGIKSGFYNSSIAPMMQNHLELLKRSLSTGVPLNEVADEYPEADVLRNINVYRTSRDMEPLSKEEREAQEQYIKGLKEQMAGETPENRLKIQKTIDEILDYQRRWEIDPYTQQILKSRRNSNDIGSVKTPGSNLGNDVKSNTTNIVGGDQETHYGNSISTRTPNSNNPLVDPNGTLVTNWQDASLDPGYVQRTFNLARNVVPGLRNVDNVNDMISILGDNAIYQYENAPDNMKQVFAIWFQGANHIANVLANRNNKSLEQMAAILSVMSVRTSWYENVAKAELLTDILANHSGEKWTDEMTKKAHEINEKYPKKFTPSDLARLKSRSYIDLDNDLDRSLWLSAYVNAMGDKYFKVILPDGRIGNYVLNKDGQRRHITSILPQDIQKVVSIWRDGSLANIRANLGQLHKLRNFYNNLVNPLHDALSYTSDVQAASGMVMSPISKKDPLRSKIFGGVSSPKLGLHGLSPAFSQAGQDAASYFGVPANVVQTSNWMIGRGGYQSLNSMQRARLAEVQNDFDAGRITRDQMRESLFKIAVETSPPDWIDQWKTAKYGRSSYSDKSFENESKGPSRIIDLSSRIRFQKNSKGQVKGAYDPSTDKIELDRKLANVNTYIHEVAHRLQNRLSSNTLFSRLFEKYYGSMNSAQSAESFANQFARYVLKGTGSSGMHRKELPEMPAQLCILIEHLVPGVRQRSFNAAKAWKERRSGK